MMVWGGGRGLRLAATLAAGCLMLTTAAAALAGIGGSYNGQGSAFAIFIQAGRFRVKAIEVSCAKGAVTVQATGHLPKIVKGTFTYSGNEASSKSDHTLHMKVTGTFSKNGKTVKGSASTSGQCPKGKYTATR